MDTMSMGPTAEARPTQLRRKKGRTAKNRLIRAAAALGVAFALVLVAAPAFAVTTQTCADYPPFNDPSLLRYGSASITENDVLRLTPATGYQAGAASPDKLFDLTATQGFETSFRFQITNLVNGGADGIAFVFENAESPNFSSVGGGLGYDGLPNSLAVEFDTWNNYGADPNDNHVAVHSMGTQPNSVTDPAAQLAVTTEIPDLSDGNVHPVRIRYLPPGAGANSGLHVFLDGTEIISLPNLDMSTLLDLDTGHGHVALTSATGMAAENHDILEWKMCSRDVRTQSTTIDARPAVLDLAPGAAAYVVHLDAYLADGLGKAVANAPITFTALDGTRLCSVSTDARGLASCNVVSPPAKLLNVLKSRGYTATFAGNDELLGSSGTAKLIRVGGRYVI